jgi:hypothetical protein
MAGTVKKLQFSEGTDVGAPTDLSLATSTTTISSYVDDTAFVTANGTASEGDVYLNSTSNKFRYYTNGSWRNAAPEVSPTLTTPLITTNGSIDVTGAGTLAIGASMGANNLTLGGASSTVVVSGNLTVSGTTTTVNSTTVDVVDKNIMINKGGNDATSEGAGITVDRTGTDGSIIYKDASASKFAIGPVGSEVDVVTTSATQQLTGKDYDGGTASNTSRLTVPKNTKANLDALTRKEGTLVFATDTQSAYLDYNSTLNPLGGAGVTLTVTQASHGFTSSNVGAPLYLSGTTYTLAKADVANTAEVVGIIDSIIDTNTFGLKEAGTVTVNTAVSGGGALVAGTVYFLSAATAGQITATEPTTVGYVSKPLGVANSTTTMILTQSRGVVVGGANARTTISLANNATTTVQNVSAYAAGELSGWINIAATTPLQFYVQAQFAKNGAASDYNLAYQTTGDTPPTGFSLTVTSGGLVQAVLPSISGYSSASCNYAINAPAVGTSYPLSVQASSVLGATTGTAPAAGYIGQTLIQSRARSSSTPLTTNVAANVLSTALTITAGTWLISGSIGFEVGGSTSVSQLSAAVSLTSGTMPANDTGSKPTSGEIFIFGYSGAMVPGADPTTQIPSYTVTVSSSTTLYLVARSTFTVSTNNAYGYLQAVRIA